MVSTFVTGNNKVQYSNCITFSKNREDKAMGGASLNVIDWVRTKVGEGDDEFLILRN